MPIPFDNTYVCIIRCIAHNLKVFGEWPAGTDLTVVAKELFPKDFWNSFITFPFNNTHTIELTEDLYLELVKKGDNVSAFLKLKMIGSSPGILAEWID